MTIRLSPVQIEAVTATFGTPENRDRVRDALAKNDIDAQVFTSHKGPRHSTVLGFACERANPDGAQMLLEFGADPNAGDPSPLMNALALDASPCAVQSRIIDLLLAYGADVNAVSCTGGTALITASQNALEGTGDSADIIVRLLAAGADPALGASDKRAALNRCLASKNIDPAAFTPTALGFQSAAAQAIYARSMSIARAYPLGAPLDGITLYTISFQPTKANWEAAEHFLASSPGHSTIDHTAIGPRLIAEPLYDKAYGFTREQSYAPWFEASRRLLNAARGNVTAFVENANPNSTFVVVELPIIMANPAITTVNGVAKDEWLRAFLERHPDVAPPVLPAGADTALPTPASSSTEPGHDDLRFSQDHHLDRVRGVGGGAYRVGETLCVVLPFEDAYVVGIGEDVAEIVNVLEERHATGVALDPNHRVQAIDAGSLLEAMATLDALGGDRTALVNLPENALAP